MGERFRRHPFASIAGLALILIIAVAALVLPRLDGIEIVSAVPGADGELEISLAWRLATAPAGEIIVRAPAPEGGVADAIERIGVLQGRGARVVRLRVPPREAWLVVAELLPAGGGEGLLEALQRGRLRAARAVLPRAPAGPGSATESRSPHP